MKIVVFDDDPTGSQTVNNCPLLLTWDKQSIMDGIRNPSPLLFLLANTRSMPASLAEKTIREICNLINQVLKDGNFLLEDFLFVSRGDSTLRGHGVLEPRVIHEMLGPFDATLHVPAFFEGGRTTVNGFHLLNGEPVHLTPFARDQIFGYSTSFIPLWIEEKSLGEITAANVVQLTIDLLDEAIDSRIGMNKLCQLLSSLDGNRSVVVNAQCSGHLSALGHAVNLLRSKKRFLFRSAASLLNGLSNIPSNLYQAKELAALRLLDETGQMKPGIVIIGSHVPLADNQLAMLLEEESCVGIELPVQKIARILDGAQPDRILSDLQSQLVKEINHLFCANQTPVLYTSRSELQFALVQERISFGNYLAELMAKIVANVSPQLGYIISKGGITTHALLEKGLKLKSVQLKGQILPGLSLVCAEKYPAAKNLPIITFPGNLGDKHTLLHAWKLMQNPQIYSNL